ncbi:extracellular solute-binding protein [Paenibacillus allorhizosphaerae]|nr:extracellular solute-binding protein [Paenibacillus allorhizosphaerae]
MSEQKQPESIVELKMMPYSTSTNQEDFEQYMKPSIEKKFPNIKVEWIQPDKNKSLDTLIASGQVPDIVITGYSTLPVLRQKDFPQDLNQLVKKNKTDLNVFEPNALQSVKIYGENGELFMLPYSTIFLATFYNKDIFDKFGVPYPKENQSWEELIELAKKLTRTVDGISYRGLLPHYNHSLIGKGLSLSLVDPKTNKAVLNTDRWLETARLVKGIYSIPGNEKPIAPDKPFVEGTMAMMPYWGQATVLKLQNQTKAGNPINWDMIAYPHFKSEPGKNFEIVTNVYTLSKVSKNQEAAYNVISYLSTSEEVQSLALKYGNLPSIKMQGAEANFGSALPELKGKNIAGLFKSNYRENHLPSKYDPIAIEAFNNQMNSMLKGEIDERTALQKAEEEANKKIASEMLK